MVVWIIVAVLVCLLVYDMHMLFSIAAIFSAVYAILINEYYQSHDYYRERRFYLKKFCTALMASGIVLLVCRIIGGSASYGSHAIVYALIVFVCLIFLYISAVRGAESANGATKKTMESMIRFTEGISYADYAIFYVHVDSDRASIKADVSIDGRTDTRIVCAGNLIDLERFASYAQAHYRNVSKFSNGVFSITFPLH